MQHREVVQAGRTERVDVGLAISHGVRLSLSANRATRSRPSGSARSLGRLAVGGSPTAGRRRRCGPLIHRSRFRVARESGPDLPARSRASGPTPPATPGSRDSTGASGRRAATPPARASDPSSVSAAIDEPGKRASVVRLDAGAVRHPGQVVEHGDQPDDEHDRRSDKPTADSRRISAGPTVHGRAVNDGRSPPGTASCGGQLADRLAQHELAADSVVAAGYTQKLRVSGRSIEALVLPGGHRIDQSPGSARGGRRCSASRRRRRRAASTPDPGSALG